VRVRASFSRLQFLELQLIGALRDDTFAFIQTRKHCHLPTQFIANGHFTPFKLFT
jgi:hypothetical protein